MTQLVSIGNTRAVCAELTREGALSAVRRMAAAGLAASDLRGDDAIHLLSVVRGPAEALVAALRRAGRTVTWWGVDRAIPVAHPYSAPDTPGADRLAAALAAFRRIGAACIVVDAGTAVTVDLVEADGSFGGGAIGPGHAAMADALRSRAPALPAAARDAAPRYPARSARDAVTLGVAAAFKGLVRELAQSARERAGDAPVLITGGDADLAARALAGLRPTIVPELVLEGLAALARS